MLICQDKGNDDFILCVGEVPPRKDDHSRDLHCDVS